MSPTLGAGFGIPTPGRVESQAEAAQILALWGLLIFEPEAAQQRPQLALDTSSAAHRVTVNSPCECCPRQGLFVARPFSLQHPQRLRRVGRPPCRAVREVAQQQRLETGLLPDDCDIVLGREMARAVCAGRIACRLIAIEQHETLRRRNARAVEVRQALHGELDAGEGIAGTAAEIMHDKVDVQARLQQRVLQQPSISHFGFALAANENQPALGNEWKTPACHPMVGTPP